MDHRLERARERWSAAFEWYKDLRPVRSVYWYIDRRGALLCGGIAYTAIFSLFAALTIAFTVFSSTLADRPELQDAVFEQIDTWLPGLIRSEESPNGIVPPSELLLPSAVTWYSVAAAVVFLWTAVGFMRALRVSVRSMFDQPVVGVSPVLSKLRELLGFVLLGAMVVASAAASVVSQAASRRVEDLLGGSVVVTQLTAVGTAAVGVVLDALLVLLIIRVVARVRPHRTRDLLLGCLAAGVVAGGLRWLGTSVVAAGADRNALLAAFAGLVTVLVLVNFVARVLLLVCAWMYDPPRLDEIAQAEAQVAAMRDAAEIERVVRRGHGSGKPWSVVVRGIRRGISPLPR
ncbi:YihY/virulence factor BrkB family protein [Isoptericola sp. NEAU-Y5]|uniref:YihY/virulence factor BrkB family protein n=1 Tax=Isoptericola luteus TaxID=2879484 RepID=A0ABS7ZBG0_9MICO|nr:YhjD/YihY/BrkB family envelope integrity protein [Isoptericola sp. NEAU-Y5]MCA5892375.1 YihY/virulence factor BrkB family protein [Isoptericola sp. NEAU-Y5]